MFFTCKYKISPGPKHRKIVKLFKQVTNATNNNDCCLQRLKLVQTAVMVIKTDNVLVRNLGFLENCHGGLHILCKKNSALLIKLNRV